VPEWFTPERSTARPNFAYYPFGGDPRICIGNNFALMEMQLILATLAQRYRLARRKCHYSLKKGHLCDKDVIFNG